MSKIKIILTCEHASNFVDKEFRNYFPKEILNSHRGWDPGAIQIAKNLKSKLQVKLFETSVSRLLVEINRSIDHPKLFSEFSKKINDQKRNLILKKYYWPHRKRVETEISLWLKKGYSVVHIGIHSFTPHFAGKVRSSHFGLLHDPACSFERSICVNWNKELKQLGLKSRLNYPYWGKTDGFTTSLRKKFRSNKYAGIELEISQEIIFKNPSKLTGHLVQTLQSTLQDLQ